MCEHHGTSGRPEDPTETCLSCGAVIPNREVHLSHSQFFKKHGCTKAEYVLQDFDEDELKIVKGLAPKILKTL